MLFKAQITNTMNTLSKQIRYMLFAGVGISVLLFASIWGFRTSKFINQAISAKGIVTKLNSGGSHPQIKFITQDGKGIEYPQSGLIFGYKTGDEVHVLYNAQNPLNASINTFGALWGFPLLCLVIGLLFVFVALFGWFQQRS